MSKQMYFVFTALIVLLIAIGGFIYWQWSDVQQYKEQLTQDAKHLEGKNKPKVQHIVSTQPAPVNAQQSDGEYGVTRQGTRYLKNPAWANRVEAHTIPTGPPLEIDWRSWANLDTWKPVDWRDPRVWESYRNFWRFDRPHVNPNGTVPWRARLDNWGTPLQQFRNVSLVVRYSRRTGFRPTPDQFTEHQELVSRYEDVQALGDTTTAESLRSQIVALEASAQGVLPDPNSYFSTFYGDSDPGWENLSDIEKRRVNRVEEAVGIRNLYKRLGIEHLYEYYEKPKN